MLDLSTLDPSKGGAELALRHPASGAPLENDGSPITITVASMDSPQFRSAQRLVQNARMNRRSQRAVSVEDIEDEALDILAGATLAWSGIVLDGEAVPFSRENAKMLYRRLPWVREQVDEFMADRANFLPNPAMISASSRGKPTQEKAGG